METNKTYTLITGGTSGIGYELAKIFATNGHNLILVSRDEADLTITRNELLELGVEVLIISKDLFDRQTPFDLYNEICEKGYEVDTLVNNAEQEQYGEFSETNIYRIIDHPTQHLISCSSYQTFFAGHAEKRKGKDIKSFFRNK